MRSKKSQSLSYVRNIKKLLKGKPFTCIAWNNLWMTKQGWKWPNSRKFQLLGRPPIYSTFCWFWARLHETRSELKPVWDFTSVWVNFIISVHMNSSGVKLTSVQIWLRSSWPKWNFKPQWDFHLSCKCPQRIKLHRIIKVAN